MTINFRGLFQRVFDSPRLVITVSALISALIVTSSAKADPANWSSPVDLSPAGNSSLDPQSALSSDGTKATAVWLNDTADIIQSSFATISGNTPSWSAVSDLSTAGQDSESPQIALSSDGTRATAVWIIYNGSTFLYNIKSSSATISGNSATWSSVLELAAGQVLYDPQIELSSDGSRAIVVYQQYNGIRDSIHSVAASISGNSATWSAVSDLSTAGQSATSPQVKLSSDGSMATAVWNNGSSGVIQVRSATLSGNTASWGAVSDLSAEGQTVRTPQIAISSDGTSAIAIWRNDSTKTIQTSSATISGNTATWSAVCDISAAGQDVYYPQIEMSFDGTGASAVWCRSDGSNLIAQAGFATISGNTATWAAPENLSETGQDAYEPQISSSSDGARLRATWKRSNGANDIIQTSSGVIGGDSATWSAAGDLSETGQNAQQPQIALSSDGMQITSLWRRHNGSNWIVQAVSGEEPSPTPTPTGTPTSTATPTQTSTNTPTSSPTAIPTATLAPTPSATPIRLPDLLVTTLTGPSSWRSRASQKMVITLQNKGDLDVQSKILTKVFLFAGKTLQLKKAILLGRFSLSSLSADSNFRKTLKVRLPAGVSAKKYYFFASTDPANSIVESDESNNITRAAKKVAVLGAG